MPTLVQSHPKSTDVNVRSVTTLAGASWPSDVTKDNLISVILCGYSGSGETFTAGMCADDASNTYSLDIAYDPTDGGYCFVVIWSCIHNGAVAKPTITITTTSGSHYTTGFATELSGVLASGYAEGATTNSGSSADPSTAITVTTGSAIVGGCSWAAGDNVSITPGANYVEIGEEEDGTTLLVAAAECDASGASQNVDWTRASAVWRISAVGYKAAAGGEGGLVFNTSSMFRGMFSGMFRGVRVPLIG